MGDKIHPGKVLSTIHERENQVADARRRQAEEGAREAFSATVKLQDVAQLSMSQLQATWKHFGLSTNHLQSRDRYMADAELMLKDKIVVQISKEELGPAEVKLDLMLLNGVSLIPVYLSQETSADNDCIGFAEPVRRVRSKICEQDWHQLSEELGAAARPEDLQLLLLPNCRQQWENGRALQYRDMSQPISSFWPTTQEA